MATDEQYEEATIVGFDPHRWYVRLKLRLKDGTETTLVMSADSAATDGDGIWYGTDAEYEERIY